MTMTASAIPEGRPAARQRGNSSAWKVAGLAAVASTALFVMLWREQESDAASRPVEANHIELSVGWSGRISCA
jgi:hypothetical protein